jgi:hypothetical protein
MSTPAPLLPPHLQLILDRLIATCQDDERVVAAFLGGSYATGTADAYSDLDLGVITNEAGYAEFFAQRTAFVRQLGEPLFLESVWSETTLFFILADGTEGELAVGSERQFTQLHGGPYRVLLDKTGLLAGAVFPWQRPERAEQLEVLRRPVCWFWHDLSHFITATARGQLWWAYGQLDILRRDCIVLARLSEDFAAEAEGYDKVDQAVPAARLAPLQASCCPLERQAMLQAASVLVRFYQDVAPGLAAAHGVVYPAALAPLLVDRLERVGAPR